MKMILAVIRPEKLQDVKDAMRSIGVNGMTITSVRGHGSQSGLRFTTRTGEFCVDELEKTKIEIVVEDDRVESVIDNIRNVAATGNIGDGRIFVIPVEASMRIRQ